MPFIDDFTFWMNFRIVTNTKHCATRSTVRSWNRRPTTNRRDRTRASAAGGSSPSSQRTSTAPKCSVRTCSSTWRRLRTTSAVLITVKLLRLLISAQSSFPIRIGFPWEQSKGRVWLCIRRVLKREQIYLLLVDSFALPIAKHSINNPILGWGLGETDDVNSCETRYGHGVPAKSAQNVALRRPQERSQYRGDYGHHGRPQLEAANVPSARRHWACHQYEIDVGRSGTRCLFFNSSTGRYRDNRLLLGSI